MWPSHSEIQKKKKILSLLQCMPLGIDCCQFEDFLVAWINKHIFLWHWVFLIYLNVSFGNIVCAEIPPMKEAGLKKNY
jgi:hypothetical protein